MGINYALPTSWASTAIHFERRSAPSVLKSAGHPRSNHLCMCHRSSSRRKDPPPRIIDGREPERSRVSRSIHHEGGGHEAIGSGYSGSGQRDPYAVQDPEGGSTGRGPAHDLICPGIGDNLARFSNYPGVRSARRRDSEEAPSPWLASG